MTVLRPSRASQARLATANAVTLLVAVVALGLSASAIGSETAPGYGDAGGGVHAEAAAVTVTTPAAVFSDGFESGDTSAWTASTGLTVQPTVVQSGSWAARATSTGGAAYAYRSFSPALADLYYDGWVDVLNQSSTTTLGLVRFRTATLGAVFSVLRRPDGRLSYYDEVTKVSTALGSLPLGGWHHLLVHATIGTSGSVQISLDDLSQLDKTDNLGTAPVGRCTSATRPPATATTSSWTTRSSRPPPTPARRPSRPSARSAQSGRST